jgi:hypothetical protein
MLRPCRGYGAVSLAIARGLRQALPKPTAGAFEGGRPMIGQQAGRRGRPARWGNGGDAAPPGAKAKPRPTGEAEADRRSRGRPAKPRPTGEAEADRRSRGRPAKPRPTAPPELKPPAGAPFGSRSRPTPSGRGRGRPLRVEVEAETTFRIAVQGDAWASRRVAKPKPPNTPYGPLQAAGRACRACATRRAARRSGRRCAGEGRPPSTPDHRVRRSHRGTPDAPRWSQGKTLEGRTDWLRNVAVR